MRRQEPDEVSGIRPMQLCTRARWHWLSPAHPTGLCNNSHQTLQQPKPQHMYQEFDWCMWPTATDYRVTEQTVSVTSSSTCHKVYDCNLSRLISTL